MNLICRFCGIVSLLVVSAWTAQGQANNNFANAQTISGALITINGNNDGANKEPGEPDITGNPGGASVWYNWTAPTSGQVRIDTVGTSYDTLLAVYTGNAVNALTLVAANNDAPGLGGLSRVEFNATAGTTYRITFDGWGFRGGGGFQFVFEGPFTLNLQVLATIAIASPANGAAFTLGDNITINVTGDVPLPPIQKVDFYRGQELIHVDTTSPYNFTTANSPPGTNSFYVVALDNGGNNWTSGVVNVGVLSIGITIVTPINGSAYAANQPLPIGVHPNIPSGSITNVEFFIDNVSIGTDSTPPFQINWITEGGSRRITAIGKDNSGNSYSASAVNIAVANDLIPFGATWKYLDTGVDQGTNWRNPGFNDSTWASGPAELGYGDGDEATVVGMGRPTTYFRHSFNVTDAADYTFLVVNIRRDDGAVVYLNGTEAGRFNMPEGPIDFQTFAFNAGDDGGQIFGALLDVSLLVEGNNVVAVEIHQTDPGSSDISFDLYLLGVPEVIYNDVPAVAVTAPADQSHLVAPASIPLSATASDSDGTIELVEFLVDGIKVGEDATSPYSSAWNSPTLGRHTITARATDDQGGIGIGNVNIVIFDALGTPNVHLTAPADGYSNNGPTNLVLSADGDGLGGIDNVSFYNHGTNLLASITSPPYTFDWPLADFGTNRISAVLTDVSSMTATSAVVTVVIIAPPPNNTIPRLVLITPAPGSTLNNLNTVQIRFSEAVAGVDASDLLINGVPTTTNVTTSAGLFMNRVFTFSFPSPPTGIANFTWAPGHGITDLGFPVNPFNGEDPASKWSYTLVDIVQPTVYRQIPAAGTTVTNLNQITVTFSEPVTGVEAGDLLIAGQPALGLSSSGNTNFIFSFSQPSGGLIPITWTGAPGIVDFATSPNVFNTFGAGATWNYNLDDRTIFLQTNAAAWRLLRGTEEASNPTSAWRQPAFDDASWETASAPFFYGDNYDTPGNPGTLLSDMQGAYTSIFLRKHFVIQNSIGLTNLFLQHQTDDGFIAWINGTEVLRYNVAPGETPFNSTTIGFANEPNNNGAPYLLHSLQNVSSYVNEGTNTLSIHALNAEAASSDFGFNVQLYAFLPNPSAIPPQVTSASPAAGEVFSFSSLTLAFTEPVSGVDAGDLLINGIPATGLSSTTNTTYTFTFAEPPFGPITVSWIPDPGITDFDLPSRPFNSSSPGATLHFILVNPAAPTVSGQAPLAGTTLTALTTISVTFSKPVTGVNASDLLLNGLPATGLTGSGANYTFSFPQPPYGNIAVGWAAGDAIADLDLPPNAFDGNRAANIWGYTLVDQTPPTLSSLTPPNGALVTNLTDVTLIFSEPVTGVDAADLLVNGIPTTSVSGEGTLYSFTFERVNATTINFSWVNSHGIRDLAPVPNPFNNSAPGSTWAYLTPDTVAPEALSVSPTPFVTLRSLSQIRVTFTEPVVGIDAGDLLINGQPALSMTGSGSGPYTFAFLQPPNGTVDVEWTPGHQIRDFAVPVPNPFPGGSWTYILDPNADFAGSVLINEIMFNARGGDPKNEWIELLNITASPINLAGWRFSRGVNFVLPNITLAPGAYLVVAADVTSFTNLYPSVANVVGGWTGQLSNSEENIELETGVGETVTSVHYATQGDWARREVGNGAKPPESMVVNGGTAAIRIFDHDYNGGDQIFISGADQAEYNGTFNANRTGNSTLSIPITGSPASPATGNIVVRRITDDGTTGYSWFAGADGFGPSLELVNITLPSGQGQNWLPSTALRGTPGTPNSTADSDAAPLILDLTHLPAVPHSDQSVTITARLVDELPAGVQSATLFYRNHTNPGPGPFLSTPMLDDGNNGDGLANDGLYGAIRPPAANGTIIEFYVQATDIGANTRTWPAPTWASDGSLTQRANAHYQVDDAIIHNNMPAIRLVMNGPDGNAFPVNDNSNAETHGTMISTDGEGTKIRYNVGVRVRGAGSRQRNVVNNRLRIPNDNPWNDLTAINLNSQFVHAQLVGSAVAQQVGLISSDANVIQYRRNGVNPASLGTPGGNNGDGYGSFILLKPVGGDLAAEWYPEDPNGNVYRASTGNHNADLSYQGTNPDAYLARGYTKTANGTENDWTDLMNLTFGFSQIPSQTDYEAAMATNVNALAWMRYFAFGTLVNYGETSMFNGRGDDYALWRGILDPRFQPIGHDMDTVFGQGDTTGTYNTSTGSSIYLMLSPPSQDGRTPNMPLLHRFMTNQNHAPLFFAELKRMTDTVFHPDRINALFDQLLTGWGNGPSTVTIQNMKTHANNRRLAVIGQIPLELTTAHSLASDSGFFTSPAASFELRGTSHVIDTRSVLVNGNPANWAPWDGRWTNNVPLRPGINTILVQSLNGANQEIARTTLEVWYNDGDTVPVSGPIAIDTVWSSLQGPYQITGNLTVNAGATLTILPGTTVYISPGVDITVNNGGRLLAEGADTSRIRFDAAPGAGNWGGITLRGGPGSPESRITHAHFDNNADAAIHATDADVFLDHLTFGNTAVQYVSLDRSSFVVQNCNFPGATAEFEQVHGSGGIKAGGRGIFRRNFFGRTLGYNDSLDFTGGNRPGPILQIIHNVFTGSDDDILDLDSTDAWIERNVFMHVRRNGSPDSASAISGGADNADTSEITIVGNLFYDVDQAANAKQGNFYTMINNTVVLQTVEGSEDPEGGIIIMADELDEPGAGFYLEGNIFVDIEQLVRNQATALVTFTNNIIHQLQGPAWAGPGGNNIHTDPLLNHIPALSETTNFTSWEGAQIFWDWFSLQPGSPAHDRGPNGRDLGGVIPLGVAISGVPDGTTPSTSATLTVGVNRNGNGIPETPAGFPAGSGFTHYQWRLDGGVWSAETPIGNPINLTGLIVGAHTVEVIGKNDAGFYQNNPVFGSEALITASRTWSVDPSASPIRINEVLASNSGAVNHEGSSPDLIELFNTSTSPVDLTGMRLTDDEDNRDKFIFPGGSTIPARGYLTLYANNPDGTSGIHLGFSLDQNGDQVHLYANPSVGGALIDSVTFGIQLTDLSVGRLPGIGWALTVPTFGSVNQAANLGDPANLRINEWLALAQTPFNSDFIELYNLDPHPVALGGLFLSDQIIGNRDRHVMDSLSFIAANGYLRLLADSDPALGAHHLNFSLNADRGAIGLFNTDLADIDIVYYQPQNPNISQGRSPNGTPAIHFFPTPTPGAPNPVVDGPAPFGNALVINEVLADNTLLTEGDGRTPDFIEIYNGTGAAIDLGDLSLTDDTLSPRRFVFQAGTIIASGGHLRVRCDNGLPASADNTGFGLTTTGGGVYLFDVPANGGSLVSSILYGLQTADFSIGRIPSGGTNWMLNLPTPLSANIAAPEFGNPAGLRVNEWLANPASGDDWFEIHNPGINPVDISGYHLTDDLNDRLKHNIPALSFIGSGNNGFIQFRADGNTGAGADHVSFSLRAGGEELGISDAAGTLIDAVVFAAQTEGVSEGRFPDGNPGIVPFPGTDSPGAPNWRALAGIVINEVLTHTDLPLEDAVEIHNLSGLPIDIGGWWLSDDETTLQKYQIPLTTLVPANGFTVIYETVFTNREIAAIPFALSSGGEEIVLSAHNGTSLTGFRARENFGAALNGVAFGRYVTSDNRSEFVSMSSRTFGADDPGSVEEFRGGLGKTNSYPLVGPVTISEIMYHPPDIGAEDNSRDEFIELRNITTAPVSLHEGTNAWRLRDAVDFDFPPGTVIAPMGTLIVVSFDPVNNLTALTGFRSQYLLDVSQPIVGPYIGSLANSNDEIELRRPGIPDLGNVPSILVEKVRYFDSAPWPLTPDGIGDSLHRVSQTGFGNDSTNWVSDAPSPGPLNLALDSDNDGNPDVWEQMFGLNSLNPADGTTDLDGDGFNNNEEFIASTDPTDATSMLRVGSIDEAGGTVQISFIARPNLTYTIQWKAGTHTGSWTKLGDVAAGPAERTETVTDPSPVSGRIYRLVTPAQ